MRHFVQYRNTEKRPPAGRPRELRVYTRKPLSFVANLLGDTVWLLEGEGRPRVYRIGLVFVVDEFGPCDDPDFTLDLRGTIGRVFRPPVPLPRAEWFRDFMRRQGNFAFGLQIMQRQDAVVLSRLSGWPVE